MTVERDLLRRAQAGEDQAIGEVYDQYNVALFRYAYRLLGDAAAAEDVMSETFSRWLKVHHAGRGPQGHLSAYLYRIAHNLAVDYWRRKNTAPMALDDAGGATTDDLSESVENTDAQARARSALWKLTPDQRQVILLKYFEAQSNAEVAAVLGKPEGAIKALQHRALGALRRILQAEREVVA